MQKPSLNEQIEHILAQENALEAQRSWRGKLKRIWKSDNRKQAVKAELFAMWRGLSTKGIFTLFLIVAFIFMLTFSVI
jgi:muconolactone delta-isomerase